MGYRRWHAGFALCLVAALLVMSGCIVETRTAPPPPREGGAHINPPPANPPPPPANPPSHAPAHGVRARHQYVYYPNSCVYFESGRNAYFYLDGGTWKMGASLPSTLRLDAAGAVTIEMDSDRPYSEFHTHKGKYPPGQAKKDDDHPGKGKGKDK